MTKFWLITFASGETMEEYGTDEEDVRAFIARSFSHMGEIVSVVEQD